MPDYIVGLKAKLSCVSWSRQTDHICVWWPGFSSVCSLAYLDGSYLRYCSTVPLLSNNTHFHFLNLSQLINLFCVPSCGMSSGSVSWLWYFLTLECRSFVNVKHLYITECVCVLDPYWPIIVSGSACKIAEQQCVGWVYFMCVFENVNLLNDDSCGY